MRTLDERQIDAVRHNPLVEYSDSIERSAEYLRLALPLMSRQSAALHPLSYAVWYGYVSQANAPLRAAVDSLLARDGRLDEASTRALFRRHLSDIDPDVAERVAQGFSQLFEAMHASAGGTGQQTHRYAAALSELATALQAPATAGLQPLVERVLQDTHRMGAAMSALQQELADRQREIAALHEEVKRAQDQSLLDTLTGLANRRAFDQRLAACLDEAAQNQAGACLVVADIDRFKKINEDFGPSFGDQVLRSVAKILQACVPGNGVAARIGGEEFALLLPAMPLAEAQQLAERLRATIAGSRVRRQGAQETLARVTVSLGLTSLRAGESAHDFFVRADRGVAVSKRTGRDKVTVVAG